MVNDLPMMAQPLGAGSLLKTSPYSLPQRGEAALGGLRECGGFFPQSRSGVHREGVWVARRGAWHGLCGAPGWGKRATWRIKGPAGWVVLGLNGPEEPLAALFMVEAGGREPREGQPSL